MGDRHLVPLKTQVTQSTQERLNVIEAIGNQKHQAAAPNLLGQIVQQRADGGLVLRLGAFQGAEDRLNVSRLAAGWKLQPPAGVENLEAGAIALVDNDVRK